MSVSTLALLDHGRWRADPARSSVGFLIRHLGVATVRGQFSSFACRIDVTDDGLDGEGVIDVASIDTGDAIRDGRLRTEFFDAAGCPVALFRLDRAAPVVNDSRRLCGA